jgi:TonB family protein
VHEVLTSLEDTRRRDFRRMLASSAGIHAALALFLLWAPKPSIAPLPAVVRVDLVTMAPAPAAPARPAPAKPTPKPKPAPAPKAPPKPAPPKKIVIPEKPVAKVEPAPEAVAKPKPEPVAEPEPAAEPEQVDYADLLADLREEAGESQPQPQAQARAAATGLPGGGPGVVVSPAEFAWRRSAKMHVTRAWVLAPGFRMQPLEAEVMVRLGPGGEVMGTRISRSSGNPWYDESVERAVQKASPLPAPPDADEWPFRFTPGDLR